VTQGSDPRYANSRYGLSWSFDSEQLNATIRDFAYELVGTVLLDDFFPYDELDDELLRKFGYVDHRQYLMIQSGIF
jgi:hypothetical protein